MATVLAPLWGCGGRSAVEALGAPSVRLGRLGGCRAGVAAEALVGVFLTVEVTSVTPGGTRSSRVSFSSSGRASSAFRAARFHALIRLRSVASASLSSSGSASSAAREASMRFRLTRPTESR